MPPAGGPIYPLIGPIGTYIGTPRFDSHLDELFRMLAPKPVMVKPPPPPDPPHVPPPEDPAMAMFKPGEPPLVIHPARVLNQPPQVNIAMGPHYPSITRSRQGQLPSGTITPSSTMVGPLQFTGELPGGRSGQFALMPGSWGLPRHITQAVPTYASNNDGTGIGGIVFCGPPDERPKTDQEKAWEERKRKLDKSRDENKKRVDDEKKEEEKMRDEMEKKGSKAMPPAPPQKQPDDLLWDEFKDKYGYGEFGKDIEFFRRKGEMVGISEKIENLREKIRECHTVQICKAIDYALEMDYLEGDPDKNIGGRASLIELLDYASTGVAEQVDGLISSVTEFKDVPAATGRTIAETDLVEHIFSFIDKLESLSGLKGFDQRIRSLVESLKKVQQSRRVTDAAAPLQDLIALATDLKPFKPTELCDEGKFWLWMR